jgi:WD40 repeat protein
LSLKNTETKTFVNFDLTGDLACIAFDLAHGRVVTGSDNGDVRIWDARSGTLLARLEGHEKPVNVVSTSYPDQRETIERRCYGIVNAVAISLDGQRIVSGSSDNTVRVWHTETGVELTRLDGHESRVNAVAFSPDGRRIGSASYDRTVRIWDAETGTQLARLDGHRDSVEAITFSPDGRRVVSGSADLTLRIWDAETGTQLARHDGHQNTVTAVAFSPDGRRVVSGSSDETVRVWQAELHASIVPPLDGHRTWVIGLMFDTTGRFLASWSLDETARVWDALGGTQLALLAGHGSLIGTAGFDPTGRSVAVGYFDGEVRIADSKTGAELARFRSDLRKVEGLAFEPKGQKMVIGSGNGLIEVWDAQSITCLSEFSGHDHDLTCVAFDPTGVWLAITGQRVTEHRPTNYSVRILKTASFPRTREEAFEMSLSNPIVELEGDGSRIESVAFDSTGRRLACGSIDRTIRVWDTETHACLEVIQGATDVRAIAAGAEAFPWRARASEGETTVERGFPRAGN